MLRKLVGENDSRAKLQSKLHFFFSLGWSVNCKWRSGGKGTNFFHSSMTVEGK
jgi:hypothetical protein